MSNNSTTEVRGKSIYLADEYWIEGDTAHVKDCGHIYLVPIEETGPKCYCTEFTTWGTCPHAVAILHALGDAEENDDWYDELNRGYMQDIGLGIQRWTR